MGIAVNILVSKSLYQKVKNHPEFNFISLGKFRFKNVDDTLEVFALANEGLIVPRRKDLHGKFKKKNTRIKRLWPASILAFASLFYFVQKNIWGGKTGEETKQDDQIAVVNFENNTGNKEFVRSRCGPRGARWTDRHSRHRPLLRRHRGHRTCPRS